MLRWRSIEQRSKFTTSALGHSDRCPVFPGSHSGWNKGVSLPDLRSLAYREQLVKRYNIRCGHAMSDPTAHQAKEGTRSRMDVILVVSRHRRYEFVLRLLVLDRLSQRLFSLVVCA